MPKYYEIENMMLWKMFKKHVRVLWYVNYISIKKNLQVSIMKLTTITQKAFGFLFGKKRAKMLYSFVKISTTSLFHYLIYHCKKIILAYNHVPDRNLLGMEKWF